MTSLVVYETTAKLNTTKVSIAEYCYGHNDTTLKCKTKSAYLQGINPHAELAIASYVGAAFQGRSRSTVHTLR
jgi:hypothetical protein